MVLSHIHLSHLLPLILETAHSLVKVSEEVDPECMLLVQFVPICVFHSLQGLSGSSILQEDVPA